MTDVPFAIGEEFASKWQFLPYIERGIHQFNRIDICNVGGFTEAMKVAGWSEAHYVDLMPHNPLGPICTAATIHFSAASPISPGSRPAPSPAELYARHVDSADLSRRCRRWTAPSYPVTDGPGLGVEVNEEAHHETELQVLGSAAPEAPRRLGHQLVS